MTDLHILGIGAWGEKFGNWSEFTAGIATGSWPGTGKPAAKMLPPAVRRRAPLSVKMAVEVMEQACAMAGMAPEDLPVVYASAMGDMSLTDSICSTLAERPELISPTQFHNSVHNAATGYWTIANGVHAPANAISAYDDSSAMAFLEAATQAIQENTAVVLVFEEVAAPPTLRFACPTDESMAGALVLAPGSGSIASMARVSFKTNPGRGEISEGAGSSSTLNCAPSVSLFALLSILATTRPGNTVEPLSLPVSSGMRLEISLGLL